MDHPTVSYCDDQAAAELVLAGDAGCNADQKRHLDRAATFAHCSEVARRDAEESGVEDTGSHCCKPVFRAGPDRE